MNEGKWTTPRLRAWRSAEEVAASSSQLRIGLLKRILARWGGVDTEQRLEAIDEIIVEHTLAFMADYLEQYSDYPLTETHRMTIFLKTYQTVADYFLSWLTGQ